MKVEVDKENVAYHSEFKPCIRRGTSHTEKANLHETPSPYPQNIYPHTLVDCYTAVRCFACHRKKMENAFGMGNATQTRKAKLRTAIK
jgi:hypothetical protein